MDADINCRHNHQDDYHGVTTHHHRHLVVGPSSIPVSMPISQPSLLHEATSPASQDDDLPTPIGSRSTTEPHRQAGREPNSTVPQTTRSQGTQTLDTTLFALHSNSEGALTKQQIPRDGARRPVLTDINPLPKRRILKGPRSKVSCVRCKLRHITCIPSEKNPEGPCIECLRMKTAGVRNARGEDLPCSPYMGCFRFRLKTLQLFRVTAQTALTETELSILEDPVLLPTDGRIGYASITYQCGCSFLTGVGRICGTPYHERAAVGAIFAVDDVNSTKANYMSYLKKAARAAAVHVVHTSPRGECSSVAIIADVLAIAIEHIQDAAGQGEDDIFCVRTQAELAKLTPQDLLQAVFSLWLGMRQSTVTEPPVVEYSPDAGDSPSPAHTNMEFSTLLAQMDSNRARCVLQPLSELVIAALEYNMRNNRHENWLEVFLAFFMILSELGNLTRDACLSSILAGNATGWTDGYSAPLLYHNDVILMHEAATFLLSIWHYFNRGFQAHKLKTRQQTTMYALGDEDFEAICGIYRRVDTWKSDVLSIAVGDTQARKVTTDGLWADPLYFAAQMFEGDTWIPWAGLARQ